MGAKNSKKIIDEDKQSTLPVYEKSLKSKSKKKKNKKINKVRDDTLQEIKKIVELPIENEN